jgi:hypothetical protein
VDFIFFKYNFYVESAPSFCRNCQPSWIWQWIDQIKPMNWRRSWPAHSKLFMHSK